MSEISNAGPYDRLVNVYASTGQAKRLYIGKTILPASEDPDAVRARIKSMPIGVWFKDVHLYLTEPAARNVR